MWKRLCAAMLSALMVFGTPMSTGVTAFTADTDAGGTNNAENNTSQTSNVAQAKVMKIAATDVPTHTHIWETKYDATYHWQQCTICGAVQNKKTHKGHGLTNNGGSKICSNNPDGRAYKESCTCGYKSKPYLIILGSYDSYRNGDMSLHYSERSVSSINDIQQVPKEQYEAIKATLPTIGAGYEWVDTDNDGYGWIFCKVAIPKLYCHTGTIESIIGSEGDCGRQYARDEYYMLTRFLTTQSDTSLSALLNWLPAKDKIPENHCYYGYHEKYAKITEVQWNTLKSYFTGLWCHPSTVGWPGMDVCCSLQQQPGQNYISVGQCYDSATNQHNMSFNNGKDFTCDVCGNSATGWEEYSQNWCRCSGYHGVPLGQTRTCSGHYLWAPNGNRAFAQDIITKHNNATEDVTSVVHVKCLGDNYISGCTTTYKAIAVNKNGQPVEIETTTPSTAYKRDSTGVYNNIYPVSVQITGPITIDNTTKTVTTNWSLGYTALRIDEDAPTAYRYSDDQTANDYWKVTGNGTYDKRSVQGSVHVAFYDKKWYSKNVVSVHVLDSDKKTVIPQGNGDEWVVMNSDANDVWSVDLNLLTETNSSKDIYVQAKDATGNVSALIPMKVSFMDSKPPTVSASWNTTDWAKSKTLTVTASDLSGTTNVGLSTDDMPDIQKAPYNGTRTYTYSSDVYSPRTLTIYAQDSAGNLGQTTVTLDKIDTSPPTITSASQTGTGYHQAMVTVTANDINTKLNQSGSGVCQYGIAKAATPNSVTWTSGTASAVLTVSELGDHVVYAKDNAGNISSAKSIKVTKIQNRVTFNSNGGTGTMAVQDMVNDTATALSANTFTRTGYTFQGWNTKADGTGISYADKASIKLSSDMTLYAQWKFVPVVVRVPKAVSYSNMPIGAVNVSASYNIIVDSGNSYTVTVKGTPSGLTAKSGSLNASTISQSAPLVFDKNGTKQDSVHITGTTHTADKWKGAIQYSVSVKWNN